MTNVLGNENGELWSIDEHQIGVRKTIFGKKHGWVKDISIQMVDEAIDDLLCDYEVKVRKIVEKMRHYQFEEKLIVECGKNYKNLKERVYNEMGWNL